MSVDKDNMFWKALMEHKVPKKKLKKKNTKLNNAKELALKYHISKDDVEKVCDFSTGPALICTVKAKRN